MAKRYKINKSNEKNPILNQEKVRFNRNRKLFGVESRIVYIRGRKNDKGISQINKILCCIVNLSLVLQYRVELTGYSHISANKENTMQIGKDILTN